MPKPMTVKRGFRVSTAKPPIPCPIHFTPLDKTGLCPVCEKK